MILGGGSRATSLLGPSAESHHSANCGNHHHNLAAPGLFLFLFKEQHTLDFLRRSLRLSVLGNLVKLFSA